MYVQLHWRAVVPVEGCATKASSVPSRGVSAGVSAPSSRDFRSRVRSLSDLCSPEDLLGLSDRCERLLLFLAFSSGDALGSLSGSFLLGDRPTSSLTRGGTAGSGGLSCPLGVDGGST